MDKNSEVESSILSSNLSSDESEIIEIPEQSQLKRRSNCEKWSLRLKQKAKNCVYSTLFCCTSFCNPFATKKNELRKELLENEISLEAIKREVKIVKRDIINKKDQADSERENQVDKELLELANSKTCNWSEIVRDMIDEIEV